MKVYLIAETEAEKALVMNQWEVGDHLPVFSAIGADEQPIVLFTAKIGEGGKKEDVYRIVDFKNRTIEEEEDIAGLVGNPAFPF